MKKYFWTMQDDEGIQGFGTLEGASLLDAIEARLRAQGEMFGASLEEMDEVREDDGLPPMSIEEHAVDAVDWILESFVNGDSDCEVAVFDLTDMNNPIRLDKDNRDQF